VRRGGRLGLCERAVSAAAGAVVFPALVRYCASFKIATSSEWWRHDRDRCEMRAVVATMIATGVRPRLSGELIDDRQLTAVAISGRETAVSSRLSRSCGAQSEPRLAVLVVGGPAASVCGRRWRQDRDVRGVVAA